MTSHLYEEVTRRMLRSGDLELLDDVELARLVDADGADRRRERHPCGCSRCESPRVA